jgi:hypothetical protein
MTRNGKIARLPREIRNELNRRLFDAEPGPLILKWLNSLPEVQSLLHRHFDARDINLQNLSDWRNGGYRDWLAHEQSLSGLTEIAENAAQFSQAAGGRITDHFATILAARYAAEFTAWDGGDAEDLRRRLRILHDISLDLFRLRRGDHQAAHLQIEQTRLDQDREKTEEEVIQYFRRWLEYPKVRESILASDDPEKLMREVFGTEKPRPADQGKSS